MDGGISDGFLWIAFMGSTIALLGLVFLVYVYYIKPKKVARISYVVGGNFYYQRRLSGIPGASLVVDSIEGQDGSWTITPDSEGKRTLVSMGRRLHASGNYYTSDTTVEHHLVYSLKTGDGTREVTVFVGLSAGGYLQGMYVLTPVYAGQPAKLSVAVMAGDFEKILPYEIIRFQGLRPEEFAITTRISEAHAPEGWIIRLPGFDGGKQTTAQLIRCEAGLADDIVVSDDGDQLLVHEGHTLRLLNPDGTASEFGAVAGIKQVGASDFYMLMCRGTDQVSEMDFPAFNLIVARLSSDRQQFSFYAECEWMFRTATMPGFRTADSSAGSPKRDTEGKPWMVALAPDGETILFVPGKAKFVRGEVWSDQPAGMALLWVPNQKRTEVAGIITYYWKQGETRSVPNPNGGDPILEYQYTGQNGELLCQPWCGCGHYGTGGKETAQTYGLLENWTPLREGQGVA